MRLLENAADILVSADMVTEALLISAVLLFVFSVEQLMPVCFGVWQLLWVR